MRLITFSVAVFLGLASAQTAPMQEALQSIVSIPAYATPKYQSELNKQYSSAFGTPQFGGEDFGGYGTLESYSFSPDAYMNTFGLKQAKPTQQATLASDKVANVQAQVQAEGDLAKN